MAAIDAACARAAARNYGIISRSRAMELGMSWRQIRDRVIQGTWIEIYNDMFFIAGTTPTWESRLVAAIEFAGPGSAAAGRSAAAFFELDGCRKGPIEVLTTGSLTRAPFRCRRTKFLPPHHVVVRRRIRTTTPARTVFDLAAALPSDDLYRVATDVLRKNLSSLGEFGAVHAELAACGRNGTRAMADFLAEYDPQLALTANNFEAELFKVLSRANLRLPQPQEPILDSSGRVARYDFVYPDLRIVIEADGFNFHRDPRAKARDERRRNRLTLDGWLVLVFTWEQVMFRPEEVVVDVADALAARS